MSWSIACFCGYVFVSDDVNAQCPKCGASSIPPQKKLVSDQVVKEMYAELELLIELAERNELE